MSVISNNQLAGAAGQGGADAYEIPRSLRFNSSDSAYLSRTPSSAGNRKTWTWAGWVKRTAIGAAQQIFGGNQSSNPYTIISFMSDDTIRLLNSPGPYQYNTQAVFRDPSSWYHIIFSCDTTQATAANRFKIYVNGTEYPLTVTSAFPQNYSTQINTTTEHRIGRWLLTSSLYFDGYLADVHFIDGQALAPTDFGEFDDNNVWQPKEYSGSYGTNGFHLDFSDPSDLGNDKAGSNNWTPNNLVGSVPGLSTANQGMDVVTYTGNGSSQSITLAFQPDLVWFSTRNAGGYNKYLIDSVRGIDKYIVSHKTNAEGTSSSAVTAFNSNGFTVGNNSQTNENNRTMVAWCWKAGGTAVSNTDGTITSQVSANNDYGFSIVKWTGSAGAATVGHGLSSAPKLILLKFTGSTSNWSVYHSAIGNTKRLVLNSSGSTSTASTYWNDTSPTSSVFSVGGDVNAATGIVAYCWSEVAGFSKFGSVSAGSNPVVTTGFKPRYVLLKRTDATGNWFIFDTARGSGTTQIWLEANNNGAENNHANGQFVFRDDGFQLIGSDIDVGTVVYAAFAAMPDQSVIDSLIDTPTNYEADSGNNGGNYATLNPLARDSTYSLPSLSNGNLDAVASSSGSFATATFGVSNGKYYWEFTAGSNVSSSATSRPASGFNSSNDINSTSFAYRQNGATMGLTGSPTFATYQTGDTIGIALNVDSTEVSFYKNGSLQGSGAYTYSNTANIVFPGLFSADNNGSYSYNFGQRPFAYTPPSGYKSLCTTNLPDPTIADGSTAFDTKLYTGNGSTQTISGLNFSPDFVWLKGRSLASNHQLYDTVRGATKIIESDRTTAETTYTNGLTSFDSNGFSIGNIGGINSNNNTFAAWAWDAGTSTVSNTDGNITSSVRANPSTGFSIVGYTVGSNTSQTIGHGLNAVPELIIVKETNQSNHWNVYHSSVGNTKTNYLNLTNAATTNNLWDNTSPTSSVFTVRSGGSSNFYDGKQHIAYCFAPVEGYSAFGTYTGNGNADGPFVYTGFKPRWVMIKRTNSTEQWAIWDAARDSYNAADDVLWANTSTAEDSNSVHDMDFLSNGFKLRYNHVMSNGSGSTYIYAAFAENPFKTARAR